jgi:addiction module RelE/StbE family toxin
MWQILEHKQLNRRFKSFPIEILKRYEKWKDIVRISGPEGLKQIRGFKDEALRGQWNGYRSSRLSIKYRVIYKVEASEILVKVIDLTPHDYRKHRNE